MFVYTVITFQCFGELEGKPQWQLQKAARKAKQLLPDFTPTGGETLAQVEHRCSMFFSQLCSTMFQQAMEHKSNTTGCKEGEVRGPKSLDY